MNNRSSTYGPTPEFLPLPGESPAIAAKSAVGCFTGGSLLPGRNYSSNTYRFGFNGQEKDDEIYGAPGTSYTAEFWQYDPRTVRRWNLDPIVKHWESPYACFNGNPIVRIDPRGNNAGDYHDKSGKKIGTDGIDDGLIHVVPNKAEAKAIRKQDKAGGVTPLESVRSAVTLPSLETRKEVGKVMEMDKDDPLREYGGLIEGDGNVLWAKPGPTWGGNGNAEIDVFAIENPGQLSPDRPLLGTFHSHPSGTYTEHHNMRGTSGMETIGGISSTTRSIDQSPSPQDLANAKGRAERGITTGNSYVIGASSQMVTIYNGTGVLTTFPMSAWLTLGR